MPLPPLIVCWTPLLAQTCIRTRWCADDGAVWSAAFGVVCCFLAAPVMSWLRRWMVEFKIPPILSSFCIKTIGEKKSRSGREAAFDSQPTILKTPQTPSCAATQRLVRITYDNIRCSQTQNSNPSTPDHLSTSTTVWQSACSVWGRGRPWWRSAALQPM